MKLTPDTVHTARERYASGESIKALAIAYDVGYTTMVDAIRGRTFKSVGGPVATRYKLNDEQLLHIAGMKLSRGDATELSQLYGVSSEYIKRINDGTYMKGYIEGLQ